MQSAPSRLANGTREGKAQRWVSCHSHVPDGLHDSEQHCTAATHDAPLGRQSQTPPPPQTVLQHSVPTVHGWPPWRQQTPKVALHVSPPQHCTKLVHGSPGATHAQCRETSQKSVQQSPFPVQDEPATRHVQMPEAQVPLQQAGSAPLPGHAAPGARQAQRPSASQFPLQHSVSAPHAEPPGAQHVPEVPQVREQH